MNEVLAGSLSNQNTTNIEAKKRGRPSMKNDQTHKEEFASIKDVENLTSLMGDVLEKIGVLSEKINSKPKEQDLKDKFEEKSGVHIKPEDSSGNYIPPKWREIVNKSLGSDFDIKVVYPETGSGFLFKIVVPESKSNMTEAYKMRHKVDIRTKALGYSDAISGIQVFCEKIAKNLGLKKKNNIIE